MEERMVSSLPKEDFPSNTVQLESKSAGFITVSSVEGAELGTTQHSKNNVNKQSLVSSSIISKLVKRQESVRVNAEAAVMQQERRLKLIESSKSIKGIGSQVVQGDVNRSPEQEKDFTGEPYSCVYVSPIYDDKIWNMTHRTQTADNSRSKKIQTDGKGMELNKLKGELQKQQVEIVGLKAELERSRLHDMEEERSIIFDKFVDRVNPAHDVGLLVDGHFIRRNNGAFPRENASGDWDLYGANAKTHRLKGLGERATVEGKPDIGDDACVFPEFNGSADSQSSSKCDNYIFLSLASYLATLQASVENLCNSMKMHESTDINTLKINSGAMDDELFILKTTLNKLVTECKGFDFCNRSLSATSKVRKTQTTVGGNEQDTTEREATMVVLHKSCMEKDKKLEELKIQTESLTKEIKAVTLEKNELVTMLHDMCKEVEEQQHRIEELLSINQQLLEFSQAKEEQLEKLGEAQDGLGQHVIETEDRCSALETLLQEKDKEIEEIFRRLKAVQIAADTVIIEKIELSSKVQALQQEAEKERGRYEELLNINEELLALIEQKKISCPA